MTISRLLFMLALLTLPTVSHAASPTATLSVDVVPSSSGIACDIGPNYAGPVPSGAAAAGFTHCAANYDFSSPQYSNLSTWLDVCGASTPQWFVTPSDGVGNPAPCSAWSITRDGAMQVLQMHWEPSFLNSNVLTTGMQTAGIGKIQDFPQGSYFQATFRSTPGSFADARNTGAPFVSAWWSWQKPPSGIGVLEYDFLEVYAFNAATGKQSCGSVICGGGANGHNWNNNASLGIASYEASGGSGFDPTIYETIGTRITNDGAANIAVCGYLNNNLISCGTWSPSQSQQYQNRSFLVMYDGPQANNGYRPTVAQDIFVKDIVVFTCDNWRTGQCLNNPVLRAAP
jgi:hypothetical protein